MTIIEDEGNCCNPGAQQDKIHFILCNLGPEHTQTGDRRSWGYFAYISIFTFTHFKYRKLEYYKETSYKNREPMLTVDKKKSEISSDIADH